MTEINKEIEEMAEIIAIAMVGDVADNEDIRIVTPIATALRNAHYRLESEVVKQFAEKVVEAMNEHAVQHGYDPEGLPYYTIDIAVLQIEIEQQAEQYGKEV